MKTIKLHLSCSTMDHPLIFLIPAWNHQFPKLSTSLLATSHVHTSKIQLIRVFMNTVIIKLYVHIKWKREHMSVSFQSE